MYVWCLIKKGRLLKDLEKEVSIINLNIDRTYKSIFPLKKIISSNEPDIFFQV